MEEDLNLLSEELLEQIFVYLNNIGTPKTKKEVPYYNTKSQ